MAQAEEEWMDVALTRDTKVDVNHTLKGTPLLTLAETYGYVEAPMEKLEMGLEFESAQSYKFRVAAVNAMGVGPWSEVTAYRTLTPGLPGAPNTVKVNKSDDGAIVSWEAPTNPGGEIKDFAVFLAINNGSSKVPSFQRVYSGTDNRCIVTKSQLDNATVDTAGGGGGKPAIIFRIAARNDKGFGPATQVRWLQNS